MLTVAICRNLVDVLSFLLHLEGVRLNVLFGTVLPQTIPNLSSAPKQDVHGV